MKKYQNSSVPNSKVYDDFKEDFSQHVDEISSAESVQAPLKKYLKTLFEVTPPDADQIPFDDEIPF